MEWKTFNSVGVRESAPAKRAEHAKDIDWLTRVTRRWPEVCGYAVFADLRPPSISIECQRIRRGKPAGQVEFPARDGQGTGRDS